MIYLVTALYSEARPLIDFYDLKHDHRFHKNTLYTNDDVILVIGGLGKIKTAVSTGVALSSEKNLNQTVIADIGIAGAPEDFEIGDLCLVNRILDESTQHTYYPDLFVKHSLPEVKLLTVDQPQLNGETGDYLVDMEASGFFVAANMYLPPSQIACFKIVSDYRKNVQLSRDMVSQLIRDRIPEMDDYLKKWHSFITNKERDVLTKKDYQLLDSIEKKLHLTTTQTRQLEKLATKFKIETNNLDILKAFQEIEAHNKNERNGIFERIRTILR